MGSGTSQLLCSWRSRSTIPSSTCSGISPPISILWISVIFQTTLHCFPSEGCLFDCPLKGRCVGLRFLLSSWPSHSWAYWCQNDRYSPAGDWKNSQNMAPLVGKAKWDGDLSSLLAPPCLECLVCLSAFLYPLHPWHLSLPSTGRQVPFDPDGISHLSPFLI